MTDETERWLTLIDLAATPVGLDWVERKLTVKEQMTPELTKAITQRRSEIEAEQEKEWRGFR